jgi:hypothetical protein
VVADALAEIYAGAGSSAPSARHGADM